MCLVNPNFCGLVGLPTLWSIVLYMGESGIEQVSMAQQQLVILYTNIKTDDLDIKTVRCSFVQYASIAFHFSFLSHGNTLRALSH